jgi:anthranilate phosphoribosyltransferase
MSAMASVLQARGVDRALLVRGDDGLDEVSLGTLTTVVTVEGDHTETAQIDAGALIGAHHDVSTLVGGDVNANAALVRRFLDGDEGPVMDVVCANAGLAVVAARRVATLGDGFAQAREAVLSGRAREVLARTVAITNA